MRRCQYARRYRRRCSFRDGLDNCRPRDRKPIRFGLQFGLRYCLIQGPQSDRCRGRRARNGNAASDRARDHIGNDTGDDTGDCPRWIASCNGLDHCICSSAQCLSIFYCVGHYFDNCRSINGLDCCDRVSLYISDNTTK